MLFPILQHQEAQCCRTCEPCLLAVLLSLGIDSGCACGCHSGLKSHHSASTVSTAALQGVWLPC